VDVVRCFTRLKARLMPYLWCMARTAHVEGIPSMRAMVLEFEKDKMCQYLDKQYMLGDSLLVAPIFNEEGIGEFYLPKVEGGAWTNYFTGERKEGGSWYSERYGYCEIPLFVRPNTILPIGVKDDTPEYEYAKDVTLQIYELTDRAEVVIYDSQGEVSLKATAKREEDLITLIVETDYDYRVEFVNLGLKAAEGAQMLQEGGNTVLSDCVKNSPIHLRL